MGGIERSQREGTRGRESRGLKYLSERAEQHGSLALIFGVCQRYPGLGTRVSNYWSAHANRESAKRARKSPLSPTRICFVNRKNAHVSSRTNVDIRKWLLYCLLWTDGLPLATGRLRNAVLTKSLSATHNKINSTRAQLWRTCEVTLSADHTTHLYTVDIGHTAHHHSVPNYRKNQRLSRSVVMSKLVFTPRTTIPRIRLGGKYSTARGRSARVLHRERVYGWSDEMPDMHQVSEKWAYNTRPAILDYGPMNTSGWKSTSCKIIAMGRQYFSEAAGLSKIMSWGVRAGQIECCQCIRDVLVCLLW